VASLSQSRTAAAQCGLFTHKSVPVIFEPPCTLHKDNLSEDLLTFMIISRSILLRMRKVSGKICRENQNTFSVQ